MIWMSWNIFLWALNGLQILLNDMNLVERIYASVILKWILLFDLFWITSFAIYLFKRKNFMTSSDLHYLTYKKIDKPNICVVIPAYNEEKSIQKVVHDFKEQAFVKKILVIDNHSTDNTVKLAQQSGATVISKEHNMGYAHSWWFGLSKSLEFDVNIIAFVDSDNTYNAYDLRKMVPYLDNCDMVIGNRLVQALTEKGNQNNTFLVWGNSFIAKLFQIKYINIRHLGFVQLNDAGCSFRCFRKDSLKKIIHEFTIPRTNTLQFGCNYITVGMFTTAKAIEKNLKIVEIPITFKKRIGKSKTQASKFSNALYYGLYMIWYILKS